MSDQEIQQLLSERDRVQEWLQRLAAAAPQAPPGVMVRVRGDYEARLATVVSRLRAHATSLATELAERSAHAEGLAREAAAAEEARAEVALRHAVGELVGEGYDQRQREVERLGRDVAARLAAAQADVARLRAVLADLERPAAPATPAAPAAPMAEAAAAPAPAPAPPAPAKPKLELVPGATALRQTRPTKPNTAIPELAFLDDLARNAVGTDSTTPHTAETPVIPVGRTAENPILTAPPVGSAPGEPGYQAPLLCKECGAENRPTEWYCTRCGAELASV